MNEEEQVYKDHLKRMGKQIANDINDEIKKINLIAHSYPNFAGEINTEEYERRYHVFYTALTQDEISNEQLEGSIKGIKQLLYDLRHDIYTFEQREDIHYEIGLAKLLSRTGKNSPEQVAPKHLQGLPNIGSIGGKKIKKKTGKLKRQKLHKKTKRTRRK
jgi:2-keto-4-pentenoate hydratase/2-oxohepta-3-ene-1,7-dioic acid hydratase in catechol pathway